MIINRIYIFLLSFLSIAALNSRAQSTIVLPDSLLSTIEIDSISRLSKIQYEPILNLYRASLTEENIQNFANVLQDRIYDCQNDSTKIELAGREAIILEFVENISNLPWIGRVNVNYNTASFHFLEKPRVISQAYSIILSKWLNTNLNNPIPKYLLKKYIIYASTGYFLCLASEVSLDYVYTKIEPFSQRWRFYNDILTTDCFTPIEHIAAELFKARINKRFIQIDSMDSSEEQKTH